MDNQIPPNMKASIIAEIDAQIAGIDDYLGRFNAEQQRWQQEAAQRRQQLELGTQLRKMAREIGFKGTVR
jgi:hypothetical protein